MYLKGYGLLPARMRHDADFLHGRHRPFVLDIKDVHGFVLPLKRCPCTIALVERFEEHARLVRRGRIEIEFAAVTTCY
jgi:hypothetical protein